MSFPFESMTEQEVFDKVAEHLLTQHRQSLLSSGKCAYRGENGLMCAAGCLIPDDLYDLSMECLDWEQLVKNKFIPEHQHYNLIDNLQYVHDSFFPIGWKAKLREIAFEFDLEFKFDNFVPGEQQK